MKKLVIFTVMFIMGLTPLRAAWAASKIAFLSNRDGNSEIYVMNADGSNQTRLTFSAAEDGAPVFNSDGSKIAFQSQRDGNYEIYIMNADGSGQTRLTNNAAMDLEPDFSPDGSKITFFSERDGNPEIYVMNADGTGQADLTNSPAVDYGPSFSANGSVIAFASSRDSTGGIYTVNVNTLAVSCLSTQSDFAPDYSSDGSKIMFHSLRDGSPEIYVMNADGTSQTNLTNNAADDSYGMFSPDGSQIAFRSNRDGNYEVFTVNIDGTSPTAISDNAAHDDAPTWAPGAVPKLPSMRISNVSVTEGHSGTANAVFTVTLSAAIVQPVLVNYVTVDRVATANNDYTAASGTLGFSPGEIVKTVTIPVLGDATDENNETFFVNLTNASNANIADGQGIGTINDDDAAPGLNILDTNVTEGSGGTVQAAFTVTLSALSGKVVKVQYQSAAGGGSPAATAGTDFSLVGPINLTFQPGQITKTVNVSVLGDTIDEGDEKFVVNLSGATNATIADNSGRCTILDNDDAPAVSINDPQVTEGDTGTVELAFTLTLSNRSDRNVQVNYKTTNAATDPATVNVDYFALPATNVIFAPGELTKIVTVTVNGDLIDEANEQVGLTVNNASNATIGDGVGAGRIIDNDATPSLSIGDVSVVEGNSGTKTMQFTVTLSAASGKTVTVNYQTTNGGAPAATAGVDYAALASATLTFAPGQTGKVINVTIYGDAVVEGNEQFRVLLSGQVNATIADNTGSGTITNDDASG